MSTLIIQTTRPRAPNFARSGSSKRAQQVAATKTSRSSLGRALTSLPFDALRYQYAGAVMAGLVPRSLLASAASERAIDRLEKLVLGPMARQR